MTKGTQYASTADPAIPQSIRKDWQLRRLSLEQQQDWVAEFNTRWAIVDTCETCKGPLIADELISHRMKHVPDAYRPVLRMLFDFPPDQRAAIMALLTDLLTHES